MTSLSDDLAYFSPLEADECLRLLSEAWVGRVIWNAADGLSALPVNHELVDGAVRFCTTLGSPLASLTEPTLVAFQVDQIDPETRVGWSVLVRGTSGPADGEGNGSWLPGRRGVGVRIVPDKVTGRVVSSPMEEDENNE